jgi:hypothetical protein
MKPPTLSSSEKFGRADCQEIEISQPGFQMEGYRYWLLGFLSEKSHVMAANQLQRLADAIMNIN